MNPSRDGCGCGRSFTPKISEKRCENCKCFRAADTVRELCYECEIVPLKGCKYFEPKR